MCWHEEECAYPPGRYWRGCHRPIVFDWERSFCPQRLLTDRLTADSCAATAGTGRRAEAMVATTAEPPAPRGADAEVAPFPTGSLENDTEMRLARKVCHRRPALLL